MNRALRLELPGIAGRATHALVVDGGELADTATSALAQGNPLEMLARIAPADYTSSMASETIAKDFLAGFKLLPVEGHPDRFVIRARTERHHRGAPKRSRSRRAEMTEEDWDKFEKDIADAFEQVP